jgi:PAS domain S-box-containing protein
MVEQRIATKPDMFEQATRQLRWATVAIVLITFPYGLEQTASVYLLLLAFVAYNTLRYVDALQVFPTFRSPIFSMIADIMFAGMLVILAGNISTPYSAIFVLMILTAAYLYQMRGVLIVTAIEAMLMLFVVMIAPYSAIYLENWQTIVVTLYSLLAFGYLVTQFTRGERKEKHQLERLQQQSDQERIRLLTLVDSLHVAILVTNQKGKIIQHNEAAHALVGATTPLAGSRIQDEFRFFRRTDPSMKPVYLFKGIGDAQSRRDLSIMNKDKLRVDLDISVTPVQIGGKPIEYIVVCEDISKQRTLEEQRTSFISVASHELRTPIAVMEAALESALMSTEGLAPQMRAVINQAHRSAMHLADIVKDLAILGEAQNDAIPVNLTKIDAGQLLTQCLADFRPQAQEKGLKLRKIVKPGTPSVLSTEHHVREILQNLVTNALKYSEKGSIILKAEASRNGGVRFSVTDEGIGIASGDQKQLFTKFFRADNSMTHSTGGTGLGLYLCMELAERLGARIWFKSIPGKGSTFFLEVPPQPTLKREQAEIAKTHVTEK